MSGSDFKDKAVKGSHQKYVAYPEYKESGVEWLGAVPESWKLTPLKYLSHFNGGGTPSKDKPEYWNGNIPWISPKDMKKTRLSSSIDKITDKAIEASTTQLLPEGALLMVVRSGILQHSIPVAINDVPVTLNQDMKAIRFNDNFDVNYGMYLISGNQKSLLLEWGKQGATVESIEQEYLSNTLIPVPSLEEQQTIANFLDFETAKIDTLIEKQQRLIALLKEKRQAVISHAVTKGLHSSTTKMKDSGVEWLGEVPAHWISMQIRRILPEMEQGKSPECESREAGTLEWGVLKTSCVNQAVYNSRANKALPNTIEPFAQYEVKNGDVLMLRASGSRDLIGSVAYVYETREKILLSDKVFRLHLSSRVNRIFFSLLMQSSYMRSNIECAISGAEGMANNITKSAVIGFNFTLPPEDEQDKIVDEITKKLDVFDRLIIKAEAAIKLMQERRTALISAAVTGKIDVRGLVPLEDTHIKNPMNAGFSD